MADNITYICKRTVVSTKPVQPEKYCTLSVLDRLMEQNHLRIVYYFGSQRGREPGELTKKLRESLSEVLTYLPIMTGRLQKNQGGQWMINCNDAGVRMVEARAKGSVEEWLKTVDREKELKLVHWEEMFHKPYFWSTFYVQLTEFEEGGVAVGLSCIHLLADPVCATMFLNAWADITLLRKVPTPPLLHPLPRRRPANKNPNHKTYTDLLDHYKFSIQDPSHFSNVKNQATVILAFSDPMVRDCMAMARASTGASESRSGPSAFEALAALFWVSISKLKANDSTKGLLNMSICLDMRSVLGLDKTFFGNCMVYNKVRAEFIPLSNNMLPEAARAIGKVMTEMDTEGIMDLIEWLQCNDQGNSAALMNGCDLICASLESVDPYLPMFEDGFPALRVSHYVEPVLGQGQVLIFPSKRCEGPLSRVVMATLPEDELVKLCEDDMIQRFSPAILMGINKNP